MTDKEVKEKAKAIDEESTMYHLSHAVLACNVKLRGIFREYTKEKLKELNATLIRAKELGEESAKKEALIAMGNLQKPGQVYVEYIQMAKDAGRSSRVGNQLVIYLPLSLAKETINADGSYNPHAVKKLRKIMAHELGHIVLHTKELLSLSGTQGTKDITREQEEHEACIFAKELLELREKRNSLLYKALS